MARDKDKNAADNKCLGCSKTLTNSHCHQCTICGLWIHKACSGISDEFFKMLEEQVKNTGSAFWACRPCTAYSQGITRKVKDLDSKVTGLQEEVKETQKEVRGVQTEVKLVEDRVKKIENNTVKVVEDNNKIIFEEMRERESRRLNVVMHGVPEQAAPGREKQVWDRTLCVKICQSLDLDYSDETFKFCRRVGPAEEGPRPLVAGFYT